MVVMAVTAEFARPATERGLFTRRDVRRLTGLTATVVRPWFAPVEPDAEIPAANFHGLVDVYVGGHLVAAGEPLRRVKQVHDELAESLVCTYPFAHATLSHDAGTSLRGDQWSEAFAELAAGRVYRTIISPFLTRLDYEARTRLAARWRPAPLVVIDPGIAFGRPTVAGVPTYLLAEAYRVNGRDYEWLADWYGLTAAEVAAAVEYEARSAP